MKRSQDELFAALAKSAFRARFRLQGKDVTYFSSKGLSVMADHARDFVARRLAPAVIANEGKQTPFRGHPVFVAQHATACCCRGCLQKWHGIPVGRPLEVAEQAYIVAVLMRWLQREQQRLEEVGD